MNFITPLLLTLKLSIVTMVLLFIIGIPLAYWLAFSTLRLKFIVESVIALPLVLPPTVLGFYLLMAIGRNSFIGYWYEGIFNKTLAFSFQGLVIGSFMYNTGCTKSCQSGDSVAFLTAFTTAQQSRNSSSSAGVMCSFRISS